MNFVELASEDMPELPLDVMNIPCNKLLCWRLLCEILQTTLYHLLLATANKTIHAGEQKEHHPKYTLITPEGGRRARQHDGARRSRHACWCRSQSASCRSNSSAACSWFPSPQAGTRRSALAAPTNTSDTQHKNSTKPIDIRGTAQRRKTIKPPVPYWVERLQRHLRVHFVRLHIRLHVYLSLA